MAHRLLLIVCFLITLPPSAFASRMEAFEAFERGKYATALKEIRPLAEGGDPWSQNFLGTMYRDGKGVTQDHGSPRQPAGT